MVIGEDRWRQHGGGGGRVNVLGLWDGHDAGAALVVGGRLVAAVNEERFSRRKLEVGFPSRSISVCLEIGGLRAADVDVVAASTSDLAKTLSRWWPATKERHYLLRRRLCRPGTVGRLQKRAKYWITEIGSSGLTHRLSRHAIRRELSGRAICPQSLWVFDHHACHAAAAAWGSRMDPAVVITVDGVGDGLAATVSVFGDGRLQRVSATPARDSLGVFFEHVTNLLNMRELEDEGKVMALADYTVDVDDADNPLLPLITVDGLRLRSRVAGHAMYSRLRELLWSCPNEQFAWMAQRTVELRVEELVINAVRETGIPRVALAGGVASNIKANRRAKLRPEVEDLYVFPHMGDGGLAVGAAVLAVVEHDEKPDIDLNDVGLGPGWTLETVSGALSEAGLPFTESRDVAADAAELIAQGRIVLWFQGRMEYGPRALGHRSVLARPDRLDIRHRLNLTLKKRVWYQPFGPSILERDARRVFCDWKGAPNRHMTTAYRVDPAHRARLEAVVSVDGSCRAQVVSEEQGGSFAQLLKNLRRRIGIGAALNTSFNLHGQPLVCTPDDAIAVFRENGADALVIGPMLVRPA